MNFPPEFFEKEIRCEFEISEMMKRAWAAELEVLEVVKDICRKHHLQWFADGGTCIGAVRHQGFIPWDDDIDICMKRKDYMELIRVMPKELPKGFEMAGMYADSRYWQQNARCWYTRVVADGEQWHLRDWMKYFHGFPYQRVGIDIFPIDYLPREKEEFEIWKNILFMGMVILQSWDELDSGELELRLSQMEELCGVDLSRGDDAENALRKLLDSIAALYHEEEADEVIEYQWSYLSGPLRSKKKEWFDVAIEVPFENTQMSIPHKVDEVLTTTFGDYMKPVKWESGHGYPFYGSMEEALIQEIRSTGFLGTVDEFCREMANGR